MFKKLISVFIVFLLFLSVFSMQVSSTKTIIDSGECGDNVSYIFYDDGELIIEGSGDMWDYDSFNLSAPWYNFNLEKVTIKNGVSSISAFAFNESLFSSINIPDSIVSIGKNAFSNCKYIKTLTLPDSLSEIGDYAFFYCKSLISINIPNNLTEIKDWTFFRCESLVSLIVPDGVINVGVYAFEVCKNLTVYGNEGSYIQNYAKLNDIPFALISDYPVEHEEETTEEQTTEESTTEKNTTEEHTTEEHTTEEHTTEEHTTEEPTTEEHTAEEPTTEENTTKEPTTKEPTTKEPTTKEPTTKEPTTKKPSTPNDYREIKINLKKSDAFKALSTKEIPQGIIISEPMTADKVKSLAENTNLVLKNKDGKDLKDTEPVGSGATINLMYNGKIIDTYTVILLGDTNGDAKITSADSRFVLRASAKLGSELKVWQDPASNVNGDEKITAADARLILRVSAKIQSF